MRARLIPLNILILVLLLISSPAAGQVETPTLITQIGRGSIQSAAWYPDGERILVSTITGAWIYTRDLQDVAHLPDAHMAALSPDGQWIAATPDGMTIQVWDAETLVIDRTLDITLPNIHQFIWSPDGQSLLVGYASISGCLTTQIDLQTQQMRGCWGVTLEDNWSPDGRLIAKVGLNAISVLSFENDLRAFAQAEIWGTNVFWISESELLILTLSGDSPSASYWNIGTNTVLPIPVSGSVLGAEISADGELLAFGGYGGRITVRGTDPSMATDWQIEIPATLPIGAFAWNPNGTLLAAGELSFEAHTPTAIHLINALTGTLSGTVAIHQGAVIALEWSGDARYLLSLDENGVLSVYDVETQQSHTQTSHAQIGNTAAWDAQGQQIAAADSMGGFCLWAVQTGESNCIPGRQEQWVSEIAWQPQGDLLAVRTESGSENTPSTLRIWNTNEIGTSQTPLYEYELALNRYYTRIAWRPDGEQLAAIDSPNVNIWNIEDGSLAERFTVWEFGDTTDLLWSPDGGQIAVAYQSSGNGGSIYFYSTETRTSTSSGIPNFYTYRTWTPQNEFMWMQVYEYGDVGYVPRFRNPIVGVGAASDTERTLNGMASPVDRCFLSPTGRYAIALSDDASGLTWDVMSGQILFMVASVHDAVWSPDETRLAIKRTDGSLWLLEADGTILTQIPTFPDMQTAAGELYWSPDSRQLAHLHDGVIDVWQVSG